MKKIFFIAAILVSVALVFTACSGNNNKASTEQLAKDETYTCTMHQDVMSEKPGKCPVCGMNLEKQKMTEQQKKIWKEGTYIKPKE
jgi:Cu(I)/Ag(I) efflux system membrane fusion protein